MSGGLERMLRSLADVVADRAIPQSLRIAAVGECANQAAIEKILREDFAPTCRAERGPA